MLQALQPYVLDALKPLKSPVRGIPTTIVLQLSSLEETKACSGLSASMGTEFGNISEEEGEGITEDVFGAFLELR